MFDPWAELKRHPNIQLHIARLDGGAVGLTDGVSRIWLDDRLNQVERRCVLTHELRHLEMGHRSCQPLRVEMEVCLHAARKLISLRELVAVAPWSSDLFEMAEELCVTPQTLRDRLMGLRMNERHILAERGIPFNLMQAA